MTVTRLHKWSGKTVRDKEGMEITVKIGKNSILLNLRTAINRSLLKHQKLGKINLPYIFACVAVKVFQKKNIQHK